MSDKLEKIKVLQVVSCLDKGGTEAYIMNNLRHINREKFQFDFLVFTDNVDAYKQEIENLGGRIFIGTEPKVKSIFSFVRSIILCINKNGPYNVVHSHVNNSNGWVMLATKIAKVRTRISHSHGSPNLQKENFLRRIYRYIERTLIKMFSTNKIACSNLAGSYLYGEEYFHKHGKTLRNGIDVEKYMRVDKKKVSELKKSLGINDEHFVIGNVTRFDAKKNQEFIVDVFNEVQNKNQNSILILGGVDGGQLKYIKEKVEKLGLSDKVRFIGVRDDIEICLNMMDAYIFPSLFEGLGIVALEAQAANLPVYASEYVPNECDIGLGLVNFLELNKGAQYWADLILKNSHKRTLDENTTMKTFKLNGYSIERSIHSLMDVYMGGEK